MLAQLLLLQRTHAARGAEGAVDPLRQGGEPSGGRGAATCTCCANSTVGGVVLTKLLIDVELDNDFPSASRLCRGTVYYEQCCVVRVREPLRARRAQRAQSDRHVNSQSRSQVYRTPARARGGRGRARAHGHRGGLGIAKQRKRVCKLQVAKTERNEPRGPRSGTDRETKNFRRACGRTFPTHSPTRDRVLPPGLCRPSPRTRGASPVW